MTVRNVDLCCPMIDFSKMVFKVEMAAQMKVARRNPREHTRRTPCGNGGKPRGIRVTF